MTTDILARLKTALSDRYTIESQLGQGGMATVYLAHDVKHDRKVAVKVLRPELVAVIGAERFVQEIKTTANLQHPHILPLFDSGEADSFLYYVMPFIDGESLRGKLDREKQLSIEEALKITESVASALDYAHRQEIVHRDIKPENILLHEGQALVADFGIALAVSAAAGARMTETGLSLGTPHYMSPEQAPADRELTGRSDVYSLACVTYEMLAGEPPHMGNTAQAIIAKIITDAPRPVTELRASVPLHVEASLDKALAKLPADRFATADEFVRALTDPDAAPPNMRVAAATGQTQGVSALAGPRLLGVGVVLVIVGVAVGWMLKPAPAKAPQLSTSFYHTGDSAHTLASWCCGSPVAISRDGGAIAYLGRGSAAPAIYVRYMNDLSPRKLEGTAGASGPFFSPDGRWIGYLRRQPTAIMKIPVAGGQSEVVTELDDYSRGATWADDGYIIFSIDSRGLFRVPDGGGTVELLLGNENFGSGGLRFPHYLHESDAILFGVTSDQGEPVTHLLELASGEVRAVVMGASGAYAQGHLVTSQTGGTLRAWPFDPFTGDTTGPAFRLADGIMIRGDALGEYGLSRTGTLARYEYASSVRSTIHFVSSDGLAQTVDFPLAGVDHIDGPRFSPDGRRLAFAVSLEGNHQVQIFDIEGGAILRITFDGNTEHAQWNRGGDTLIYTKTDVGVVMRAADRSGDETIVLALEGNIEHVTSYGPWIAVGLYPGARVEGAQAYIVVANRDSVGAEPRVFAAPFGQIAPAISPDGRWMAYVSRETGRPEIYVSPFPSLSGRTAVSVAGGSEPVWSPDSRTLYYRRGRDMTMAARLGAGDDFSIVERVELFQHDFDTAGDGVDYDVRPDGNGFVMVGNSQQGSRLIVTTNVFGR